jgi:hypothetical protein
MVRRRSSSENNSSCSGRMDTTKIPSHTCGVPLRWVLREISWPRIPIAIFARRTLVIEVGSAFASMDRLIGM